jgi:selenocysteine-specific elongation factor
LPVRRLTLGTAGHIDHGKTALVEALTGRSTDRLDEERRRGISIELGFAPLDLPSRTLSVVDVPGHERLVRTMVSGATGIDLFLLVVAADDGPMPQTHEHLVVLRALGVERGVVALTKSDLADERRRAEVRKELAELVPGAPICEVSARTGEGLDELRAELERVSSSVGAAANRRESEWPAYPVLHVDRAFSLRGIGTVVTGTLRGGPLRAGEQVVILPAGRRARIRSLQSHDEAVDPALPGSRVAANLAGIGLDEVERGDVIATPGSPLVPSYRLDVELRTHLAAALAGRRLQVHHGTRDAPARVVAIDPSHVQLRLEATLMALAGERVVLREIAPPGTLGGATVVDPAPPRHGSEATERLRLIERGPPADLLRAALEAGGLPAGEDPAEWAVHPLLGPALRRFSPAEWAQARHGVWPDAPPPPPSEPSAPGPLAESALDLLRRDGPRPRSIAMVAEALGVDAREAAAALGELVASGAAVRARADLYFPEETMRELRARIVSHVRERGSITLAEARDLLGTGRKHAQAVLEHLDGEHVTIRRGEARVLRASASSAAHGDAEPGE